MKTWIFFASFVLLSACGGDGATGDGQITQSNNITPEPAFLRRCPGNSLGPQCHQNPITY